MEIKNTIYKGIEAIAIESEKYQAIFLPQQGAKLCSLKNLQDEREFVYQGKSKQYCMAKYGMGYLEGECAGVDEMFPNIDEFFYDNEPWKGVCFPDHGEVWALPWKIEYQPDKIIFSSYGIKLPYQLIKQVSWEDNNTLNMNYTVKNLSSFKMDYIWAAHMMLAGEKGAFFSFPDGLSKAYTTMSDSGTIGRYGDTFFYPFIKKTDGTVYDISTYRGEDADDYQKFYFADALPEDIGWGTINYPDGYKLTVEFPTDRVPYLGAIQAEGGKLDLRCMFLEPCTGAFDRPDLAKMHSMNSVLNPYEEHKWYLKIRLEK